MNPSGISPRTATDPVSRSTKGTTAPISIVMAAAACCRGARSPPVRRRSTPPRSPRASRAPPSVTLLSLAATLLAKDPAARPSSPWATRTVPRGLRSACSRPPSAPPQAPRVAFGAARAELPYGGEGVLVPVAQVVLGAMPGADSGGATAPSPALPSVISGGGWPTSALSPSPPQPSSWSGAPVVAVAKEKNSNGAYAREYLKEVKDNLTDSARLLVNGILPKKKSRKNAPESGK